MLQTTLLPLDSLLEDKQTLHALITGKIPSLISYSSRHFTSWGFGNLDGMFFGVLLSSLRSWPWIYRLPIHLKNQRLGPSKKKRGLTDSFFAGFWWISSPHQCWDPMILRARYANFPLLYLNNKQLQLTNLSGNKKHLSTSHQIRSFPQGSVWKFTNIWWNHHPVVIWNLKPTQRIAQFFQQNHWTIPTFSHQLH